MLGQVFLFQIEGRAICRIKTRRRDIYSMAFWTLKRASSTPFVLMVVNQLIIP